MIADNERHQLFCVLNVMMHSEYAESPAPISLMTTSGGRNLMSTGIRWAFSFGPTWDPSNIFRVLECGVGA